MELEAISLPFVTDELPPTGGRVRVEPEDFCVDELPSYDASGEGEHLYLTIEKRSLTTDMVAQALAHALGVSSRDVGYAGQKDRHAVTTQRFSVPASCEAMLDRFTLDGARITEVERHGNRLRTGHLAGNRFRILLRDPEPEALERARAIAAVLVDRGVPNAFGPQRFGRDNGTVRAGMELLRRPKNGPGARNRYKKKLYLSAAQAWLYNTYLLERLRDGLMDKILLGDVARKRLTGGMFVVDDVAEAQARFDRREILHAGPIFGRKTFPAADEALAREARVLAAFDFSRDSFVPFGKLALGTRRTNLLRMDDLDVEPSDDGVWLSFSLPSGSYATIILREFLKADVR